jgi:hypothetical protein
MLDEEWTPMLPTPHRLVLTTLKIVDHLLGQGPIALHVKDLVPAGELAAAGLVERSGPDRWSITPAGLDHLERTRARR